MLNDVENYISGYSVTASAGDSGEVDFVLTDTCGSLRDFCRMKAILTKVAEDWLTNQSSTESVYDDNGCNSSFDECKQTGSNVVFSFGAKTLILTTAEDQPAEPVTVTVPLPLDCSTNVFA